ncbi:magnesium transporter CorA family protein [Candidatus Falkowbacteria bacterium]|nr:magnesium transporter CorA family protein [Candidatus Falkowbacteria bacterium]
MSKYKQISPNIQQITIDNPRTSNDKLIWLNIENAGKKEIEYLRKKYKFEIRHLQMALATYSAQRPRISQGEGYLFLILHFPVFQNGQITAGEIDFFLTHGLLITLHNNNIPVLNHFFNQCKKDGDSLLAYQLESSAILLYELLRKLMIKCFELLDENSVEISKAEEIIFSNEPLEQKKSIARILSLRHNIINFRKIMQNHKNILKKLMEKESSVVPAEHIKKYYKELIDHSKRIWEILENQKEMIEVLYQTNESLLNYRLNNIIKTLTIFSVIVFPLTLFAAVFGMNTTNGMPFLNAHNGFWIIVTIMIFASLGMLLFFEKKRWL